jgi:hypothetical protein
MRAMNGDYNTIRSPWWEPISIEWLIWLIFYFPCLMSGAAYHNR